MSIFYDYDRLENIRFFTDEDCDEFEQLHEELNVYSDDITIQKIFEKICFNAVYTSSKIEGNTYTEMEAATLIKTGYPIGNRKHADATMITNLYQCQEYMINAVPPINQHTLREFHQMIAAGLLYDPNTIGAIRWFEVSIFGTNYVPLGQEDQIRVELDRLFEIGSSIKNVYDKSLYFHLNLAYLQPFADGNKRTARMMQNLVLRSENRSILSFDTTKSDTVERYQKGIGQYYETGEFTIMQSLFRESYRYTLSELRRSIRKEHKTSK